MLPEDLAVEENLVKAARILAPYLVCSNHVIFNFDEIDLKTALSQSVAMLLKATEFVEFSYLKTEEHDDLENQVANIMP